MIPVASTEFASFSGLPRRPVPRLRNLMGSLAVHVVMIVLLTVVSRQMSAWFREDQADWSHYQVEPLRLHLTEPLLYRASVPEPPPKTAPKPREGSTSKPVPQEQRAEAEQPRPSSASGGSGGPPVPRRLELPKPVEMAKDAPVILQPDFHPQLVPPPANLPPLAFWARQNLDHPKPPPRKFVTPGRAEAPSAPPKLAAPPVIDVPNRELTASDINISLPASQAPAPRLPVPNSATMPVRLNDAHESQAATFDRLSGQAANVLALAKERQDVKDVEIPRGLQNIPKTQPGDRDTAGTAADGAATPATRTVTPGPNANKPGSGAGSPSPKSNTAANTPGAPGQNQKSAQANPAHRSDQAGQSSQSTTAAAPAAPSPARQDPNAAASGRNAVATTRATETAASSTPPARTAASSGSSANADASPASAPPEGANAPRRSPPRPDVTRIDHPSNGSFDVVVMQSAARDDLPDVGGILTGTPVYTVYLPVGDRREWLLEYCVPGGDVAQANPYQINIDDASPVTPPYPVSTSIPTSFLGQPIPKQIVLHGFLTAAGILRNVKAPDANNVLAGQILALLSEWQFRPALRNKKPIDIEILLVIPPRG